VNALAGNVPSWTSLAWAASWIVSPTAQQAEVHVGWSSVTAGGVFPEAIVLVFDAVRPSASVTVSRAVHVPAA
jgi:hypothetical protein